VTRTPEARSSPTSATAFSNSGRFAARVEIFSEKIRMTPASVRESRVCRAVDTRVTRRTCPTGSTQARVAVFHR
jgi:hypothetical protein